MKTAVKVLIAVLLVLDLALAVLVFGPFEFGRQTASMEAPETAAPVETEAPAVTDAPVATDAVPTETQATVPPTTEATVPPTTEATVPPTTEAQKSTFVLTFAGDCTLGTSPGTYKAKPGFIKTIGSDLDYPFRNVASFFQEDDFSLVNLEGPLTESGTAQNGKTSYRGPVEYVKILTGAGIDAVTLANDHIMDYGQEGYDSTLSTLGEAEIIYAEKDVATIFKTDSGLMIGLYAVMQRDVTEESLAAAIADMKAKGAELIIVAPHWGVPGQHGVVDTQKKLAYAAIDAGANIVVGTHPHVLQNIEEYNGGIIYYSLGRFVFGGASISKEWDTAIIQQEVIRNADGTISLGQMKAIPASIGNQPGINNYQPTLYQPDVNPKHRESYDRVMEDLGLE